MELNDQQYPKEGYRFEMYGNQYDITAVISNNIRFSSVKGGKIHNISINEFVHKLDSKQCKYIEQAYYPLIDAKNYASIQRKKKYIEAALLLPYIFSNKRVQKVILKVASETNDENPPSSRTVIRWVKNYISEESFLSELKKNNGNLSFHFSPEMESIVNHGISEYFLKPQENRSAKDVMSYILNESLSKGIFEPIPSLRTIQRRINKLDSYQVHRYKKGIRTANQHFQAAGKKLNSSFIMNTVEIDSHILDVIIKDDNSLDVIGRPILTCAIDVFSRCIVGWDLSMLPPNTNNTINLLKDMFTRPTKNLPGGIPTCIIPDNGVEFKNNTLSSICENRKITILPSQKYTPNNKPHIERFFRTLTFDFSQKLKGTTFSNPSSRAEYDSHKKANLTFSQLKSLLNEWIECIYHQSSHSGIGNRRPIVVWEEYKKKFPVLHMSEHEVDMLVRIPKKRTVNNGRIQFHYLTYYSHVLANENINTKNVIILIDESNLEKIYVRNPNDKNNFIIAESTDPAYTKNLSFYEHIISQEEKKNIAEKDLTKLGKNADLYARWQLYKKIQETYANNRKLKKIKLELPSKIQSISFDPNDSIPIKIELNDLNAISQDSLKPNMSDNQYPHNESNLEDDDSSEYESMEI